MIDSATDRPILKWAGTATAAELRELLTVALTDARGGAGDSSPSVEATATFVRGNRALAAGDVATAEKEHRAALAAAPKDHPYRPRMVEALVTELSLAQRFEPCVAIAAAEAEAMPPGTSRATVIVEGLSCARDAKKPANSAETDLLFGLALADARAKNGLLPDDRSALYEEAFTTKAEAGDAAGAHALASEWATFLDDEARRAKTNDARTSLDPLRLSAYLALEEPARAIPMLEQSEKDFPSDYNPAARLARVYLELAKGNRQPQGLLEKADKAADRALARVYGPRILRVFVVKADIAKARGDRGGEIKALEEGLSRTEGAAFSPGQRAVRDGFVKRLAALKK